VADPFEPLDGFPVVRNALGQLVCRTHEIADGGDHSFFLGEVEALKASSGRPLLYFESHYARMHDMELSE
jgi:flavin reductase (DIM6/NTAB) family NADH-FMN oxidoreductase RutF